MPTYEYKCKQCEHHLEIVQSMLDDALITCPSCRRDDLQRLISKNVGISFKGEGFYVTDSTTKKTETKNASSD